MVEEEEEGAAGPRDAAIDGAKVRLATFFNERSEETFYDRQVQVLFEREFFHWITNKALRELREEGRVGSDELALELPESLRRPGAKPFVIRFYRNRRHRYWRRQADEIASIVRRFSQSDFTHGLGHHAETMFDSALAAEGFLPSARDVSSYKGRRWPDSGHNLDRIYERDGVAYGAEVKNTLSYIDRGELKMKVRMALFLGLRPLIIARSLPKSYIYEVYKQGGYALVFERQLYPLGMKV